MSASSVNKHRLPMAPCSFVVAAVTPAESTSQGTTAAPPPKKQRTPPLDRLIFRLAKYRRPLRTHELVHCLQRARLRADDLLPIPPASPEGPGCWTLYENHFFAIRCMSWLPGQRSSIHDHRGSRCCVQVVEGLLTNIEFRRDSRGTVRPIRRCIRIAGEILVREHLDIHQIANEHPRGKRLVTLHLYSPPLSTRRAIYHQAGG